MQLAAPEEYRSLLGNGNERANVTVTEAKKKGRDVCYVIWHWTSVTLLADQSRARVQMLRSGHLLRSLYLSDFLAHSTFWLLFSSKYINDILLVFLQ